MPSPFTSKGRKGRSSHKRSSLSKSPTKPAVSPGAMLYTGINEVSGWLRTLQAGLDGTFSEAPAPLRMYVQNAMLSLHELVELMTDKLPKADSKEAEILKPKEAVAELARIEAAFAPPPQHAPACNAKVLAQRKLLAHGILEGLKLLAYRKTPEAQAFIAMHGTPKTAALRLFSMWEDERETVCENNRHDPEEYRELRMDMQEQASRAHEFINSMA